MHVSFLDALSLYHGMKKLDDSNNEKVAVYVQLSRKLKKQIIDDQSKCKSHTVDDLSAYLIKADSCTPSVLQKRRFELLVVKSSIELQNLVTDCHLSSLLGSQESISEKTQLYFIPSGGREFSYAFDRSCDALYLINNIVPKQPKGQLSSWNRNQVSSFLCDGELYSEVCTIDDTKSLTFSAFDIFGLTRTIFEALEHNHADRCTENCLENLLSEKSQNIVLGRDFRACLRCRTGILKQMLPSYDMRCPSVSFHAIHKEYFEISELEQLSQKIAHVNGEYIFASRNLNDGLVFTPVSQRYFTLSPGRSRYLLKWKWPEKQTIDWLVIPDKQTVGTESVDSHDDLNVMRVGLCFHIKHKIGAAGTVLEGHIQLPEISGVCIPKSQGSLPQKSVCELQLDTFARNTFSSSWILLGQRLDKREGNSFLTICNVLEAIAENVTLANLKALCNGSSTANVGHSATYSPSGLPEVTLLAKIFPRGDMKDQAFKPVIKLQTLVDPKHFMAQKSLTSCDPQANHTVPRAMDRRTYVPQRPFPVNLFDEAQYTFASDASEASLRAAFAMAIANTGGSETYSDIAVQAHFDPMCGKWVITHIAQRQPTTEINAEQIITHLLHLISQQKACSQEPKQSCQTMGSVGIFAPALQAAFTKDSEAYFQPCSADPKANSSVFEHYDKVTSEISAVNQGTGQGVVDTCTTVRYMNNFLKFVLQAYGVRAVFLPRQGAAPNFNWPLRIRHGVRILDLCSGRGGDLMKIKHFHGDKLPDGRAVCIEGVMCVDGSLLSLGTAACRYSVTPGLSTNSTRKRMADRRNTHALPIGIPLRFVHADCFARDLTAACSEFLDDTGRADAFDLVNIQFAIHYAFHDKQALRKLFENITTRLRPGGVLVATFVDEKVIVANVRQDATIKKPVWTSEKGSCRVIQQAAAVDTECSPYGNAYTFELGSVVNGETEYLVNYSHLRRIAAEFGLREEVLCHSFADMYSMAMAGRDVFSSVCDTLFEKSDVSSSFDPAGFAERSSAFFKKCSAGRKRNQGEAHAQMWEDLPVEVREICGLYKGVILRKGF